MIDVKTVRHQALTLPETEEKDHFGMPSFRVKNKIFATLWIKDNRAMLKLPLNEQSIFCSYNKSVFFPVPGGWGKKGATFVDLKTVRKDMFKDALTVAYCNVAPKKLADKFSKK